jgi:hypothetical protein
MISRRVSLAAASLLVACTSTVLAQGGEVRLATIGYAHGISSGKSSVTLHVRLNQDEQPEDRPQLLIPLSPTSAAWMLVPEFSADVGRNDDVAANNVAARLGFQYQPGWTGRQLTTWELGPSYVADKDFATQLGTVGGGVHWRHFHWGGDSVPLRFGVDVGARLDAGLRHTSGTPNQFPLYLVPEVGCEVRVRVLAMSLTLAARGSVTALVNDHFVVQEATARTFASDIVGFGKIALELRSSGPMWLHPFALTVGWKRGRQVPTLKLQNAVEVGVALYWSPPHP